MSLPLLQADPKNPGLLRPLTEVERRAEFLEEMGPHPLRRLAEQCLYNDPRRRPTAAAIVQELERVTAAHRPPFANMIELTHALTQALTQRSTPPPSADKVRADCMMTLRGLRDHEPFRNVVYILSHKTQCG